MKINKIYIPLLIGFFLAVGILIGSLLDFRSKIAPHKANTTSRDKIDKLLYFIENEYMSSIDTDSIIENTVNGIMTQLDPHSHYIPKDDFEMVAESMKGNFVGIGINFNMYRDTLTVIRTIKNGPSEKAGLKAGDRILLADRDTIYGKNFSSDKIVEKLRGKLKSKLQVKVFRKSENKVLDYTITRDLVPLKSVDIALQLTPELGYIKINRFAETTADEFSQALGDLLARGMSKLVIDLRDNGGGYVDAALLIADEFLSDGQLIVSTKDKRGVMDKSYATSEGQFEKGELYVLINENSASSSEILAGALQDNDRATLIGKLSYGKGLVQRDMPLGDGSMVRLTVAEYYTPSGRSIQKPYKPVKSGHHKDSITYKSKSGKVLNAHGGIYPDITIENKEESTMVVQMMNSVFSSNFVFEIVDKQRAEFNSLSYSKVIEKLQKNDFYYNEFMSYFSDDSLHGSFIKDKKTIQKYLKAEFMRQLFSEEDYYKVLLEEDLLIKEVFKQEKK